MFWIVLCVEFGDDSCEVIGSDVVYYLLLKENGFVLFKVGLWDLELFCCFYFFVLFVVLKKKEVV